MSFQIKRKSEVRQVRAFSHKLADIPNGVTVSADDFTQEVLHECQPIGIDSNGLAHIVKIAEVAVAGSATTDTSYTVKKGHNFRVGEFVMAKVGGKAYAITAIATASGNSNYDTITVGTALDVKVAVGDVLMEAAAQSSGTSSKFKHHPIALVGESYDVEKGGSLMVNAVTIGQVWEGKMEISIGDDIKKALPLINFIN